MATSRRDNSSNPEFVPLPDALTELGMTQRTFYRYVSKGLLASVTHAGRTFVPRASIVDYWARLAADAARKQAARRRSDRTRSQRG